MKKSSPATLIIRAAALHHSQLRRAAAGGSRAECGETLRENRAVGATCAAHAVAYVHARRRWQESIDTNIASGAVAKSEGSTAEELHTMDYRTYAYLQTAQDTAARAILDALPEVSARFDPDAIGSAAPGYAGVFALAAIPARYAMERGDWAAAAKLVAAPSRYPYAEALTYLAKAVGAARTADAATARSAADALRSIRQRLAEAKEVYWAEQADIQHQAALAWVAFAEGRGTDALAIMRTAAMLEDGTEKGAVTPGPLVPARELVAEMLLLMNQPREALAAFETVLKREPNRFHALFGAARSASLAGDAQKARAHAAVLLKICERADRPGRADLVEVRRLATGAR